MRLLPRPTHVTLKRNSKSKRQSNRLAAEAQAVPTQSQPIPDSTATDVPVDNAAASADAPQSNVVTIVNGQTVTGPATSSTSSAATFARDPSSYTSSSSTSSSSDPLSSSSSSRTSDRTDDTSTSSSSIPPETTSDTSPSPVDSDDSSPVPISTDSSTVSDDSSSDTSTTSKVRPDRPTSRPSPSSKTKTPLPPPFATPSAPPAKPEESTHKLPVTTYIAIGAGCLGGLLLIMAMAAYYRRWKRKRDHDPARESFMDDKPPPPTVPPSPTSTIASTKERPQSPDWSDAPLVPPVPSAYQHVRSSSLPEPGSAPGPEDVAPFRQLSRSSHGASQTSRSSFSGVARPRQSATPASIITRGDSRLFSRPTSEVVLEGRGSDTDSSTSSLRYDRGPQQNHRHNSYASSKYESLRLNSHRTTMAEPELRYI